MTLTAYLDWLERMAKRTQSPASSRTMVSMPPAEVLALVAVARAAEHVKCHSVGDVELLSRAVDSLRALAAGRDGA